MERDEARMADNITMERIWQDEDFFEIRIICSNSKVKATTEIYMTDDMLEELHDKMSDIIALKCNNVVWICGERGEQSSTCLELDISIDKMGHVLIEVFMEINDGGSRDKHNCSFGINTELGLLEEFDRKLVMLRAIGKKISLSE